MTNSVHLVVIFARNQQKTGTKRMKRKIQMNQFYTKRKNVMVFIGFSDSVNGLHEKTSRKRKKSIASSTNFVGNLIWKLYGISKVKRSFHPKFRTSIRFNNFFSLYVLFFCSQQSDSSIQIKLNPLDFRHTLTVNYFNYFLYTNLEQNTYIKPKLLAA